MQARPYILAETNWKTVKDTDYQVAVLPWGATEAHNYHLPYATDNFESQYVAAEAARKAWEKGAKVIVLPGIPFGVNTGQLDVELCINMNPSTQYAILKDVTDVLLRHGIYKLVILNAHGGNNFKTMIRELAIDYPDMFASSIDFWRIGDARKYFDEPGDHAGELETSIILHLHPELVRPLEEAGPGKGKNYRLKGFKEGWATSQRHWTKVTEDTGVGNPAKSTAEKGRIYLDMVTSEVGHFLAELAATGLEDMYE